MVELNCNTDFVARNEDFRALAKGIALHIAALNPEVLKREDLDQSIVEGIKEHHRSEVTGKPADVTEKIVEGKMKTWYEERVLLDQIYVKDESKKKTVRQVLEEAAAKTGENVSISRYCRFKVGESAAAPAASKDATAQLKSKRTALSRVWSAFLLAQQFSLLGFVLFAVYDSG